MLTIVLAVLLAAAPEPTPPSATSTTDWSLPAGAALATDTAVVVWAPDFRSVLGIDPRGPSARRLWRVATGDQGGYRDLDRIGPNVLAYAGDEAILIAPDTGKVLGRQPNVRLASPGVQGCRIAVKSPDFTSATHPGTPDARASACAVVCPCSFLPLRCEDLAPAAPRAILPMFEEWNLDGDRTSTCMGQAGTLVTRGDDTLVATVAGSTDAKTMLLATDLVGFDVRTAKEAWRVPAIGGLAAIQVEPALSGALADGHTCWLGSRSGELRVFDCQRATLAWSRSLQVPAGTEPQIESDGEGLIVRDGPKVRRYRPDGQTAWEVAVPLNELFLLSGATVTRERRFAKLAGATVLDPVTGSERGKLRFSKGTSRWPIPWLAGAGPHGSPSGWISVGDKDYAVLLDGRAQAVDGTSPTFVDDIVPGRTLFGVRTRESVTVRGVDDAAVTRVDGQLIVAIEGVAGPGRVLVLKQGSGPWDPKNPKTFGELRRVTVTADRARTAP